MPAHGVIEFPGNYADSPTVIHDGRGARPTSSIGQVIRVVAVAALPFALLAYILAAYNNVLAQIVARLPFAATLNPLLVIGMAIPAVAVAFVIAFLVELIWVGWEKSSLRKLATCNKNSLRDTFYTFICFIPIQMQLKCFCTFGVYYVLCVYIVPMFSYNIKSLIPFWVMQFVVSVLISGFVQYWAHRWSHTIPLLWQIHKFHHSATEFNILNFNRESPFTSAATEMITLIPLAILGTSSSRPTGTIGPIDLFFLALCGGYQIFCSVNGCLCHSEIRSTYGWLGRWVFISPNAHRVHHSANPKFYNRNYSAGLVVWDRLFGTFWPGDDAESQNSPLGFEGNPYNQQSPVIDCFWIPPAAFARCLCASLSALVSRALTSRWSQITTAPPPYLATRRRFFTLARSPRRLSGTLNESRLGRFLNVSRSRARGFRRRARAGGLRRALSFARRY